MGDVTASVIERVIKSHGGVTGSPKICSTSYALSISTSTSAVFICVPFSSLPMYPSALLGCYAGGREVCEELALCSPLLIYKDHEDQSDRSDRLSIEQENDPIDRDHAVMIPKHNRRVKRRRQGRVPGRNEQESSVCCDAAPERPANKTLESRTRNTWRLDWRAARIAINRGCPGHESHIKHQAAGDVLT